MRRRGVALLGLVLGLGLLALIGPGSRTPRPERTARAAPNPRLPPAPAPAVAKPRPAPLLAPAPEEEVDTGAPQVPPETLVQLAEEHFDAGDADAAYRMYTAIVEREPSHELAQFAIYKLGWLAHARGDLDQAIADMERALHWEGEPDPRNPVTQSARHDLEQLYAEARERRP